jgi:hypothetical protein
VIHVHLRRRAQSLWLCLSIRLDQSPKYYYYVVQVETLVSKSLRSIPMPGTQAHTETNVLSAIVEMRKEDQGPRDLYLF